VGGQGDALPRPAFARHIRSGAPNRRPGRVPTCRCEEKEEAPELQLSRMSVDRSPGPGMVTPIRHGIGRPPPHQKLPLTEPLSR
jgi:hypothetical protein